MTDSNDLVRKQFGAQLDTLRLVQQELGVNLALGIARGLTQPSQTRQRLNCGRRFSRATC